MIYDFDNLADRSIDNARKWDKSIVNLKFPNVKEDFIPLWIADMDFKAAPQIREALIDMAENGAYGYTYSTDRWYESVIGWQKKRHHTDIKKDWIKLGYGTVPNMHVLIQAITEKDDNIVLNTPIYGPFSYAAEHNDRKVITVPLQKRDHRYYINWDLLEVALSKEKTKIMFFCNPHNPSGRIWTLNELEQIADLCLKHNVLLVSDEVHSEHIIQGEFVSSLQLPEKYFKNLVMFTSPNKAFNLGGLKLSYSIIPNEEIRELFYKQYERNSITSPNVPGQIAMTFAYESCEDWLDENVEYIRNNLKITKKYIENNFDGWELMEMESSYLPWVDVSKSKFDMHTIAAEMAKNAGVIVGVGDDYVADADNFLRLNLGTSKQNIEEAMLRMSQTWKEMNK